MPSKHALGDGDDDGDHDHDHGGGRGGDDDDDRHGGHVDRIDRVLFSFYGSN